MKTLLIGIVAAAALGSSAYAINKNVTVKPAAEFATCAGSSGTCNACKNCKYCKHCAKGGGKCSVCK